MWYDTLTQDQRLGSNTDDVISMQSNRIIILKKNDTSSQYLRQSTKRNLSINLKNGKIYHDLFSVHCFDLIYI